MAGGRTVGIRFRFSPSFALTDVKSPPPEADVR